MIDTQLILNEIRQLRELVEARLPAKKKTAPVACKKKYGQWNKVMLTDNEFAHLLKL